MSYQHILVDDPRPRVRRITLNRAEKRNALNNRLRAEVFEVLEQEFRIHQRPFPVRFAVPLRSPRWKAGLTSGCPAERG